MSTLDTVLANLPAGLVGVALITIIALLSAAALAGKRDAWTKQAADDGEDARG